jgi:hypothetical protein
VWVFGEAKGPMFDLFPFGSPGAMRQSKENKIRNQTKLSRKKSPVEHTDHIMLNVRRQQTNTTT